MPKRTYETNQRRMMTYNYYQKKYFNLFMSAYKFTGITPKQQDYILRKFWAIGSVGAFIVEGTKTTENDAPKSVNDYPNGMIAFCQFTPVIYDIYDWPIQVQLVQSRGATFIPKTPQVVDKDVVIGYAQRSKSSVFEMVNFYLEKIVDVEMTIRTQLLTHKVPWIIASTPENEQKLKQLFERLKNDDEALYITADEMEALKPLLTGNNFIIDKLFQYKTALENELLTYLGFNNLGLMEKKEHFVVDEVNSNNEVISDNSDNFLKSLQEWCERISNFLGYPMSVEATSSPMMVKGEDEEDEETEEGEN